MNWYFFQCFINETFWSNEDKFIAEDGMETASHFKHKNCLQIHPEICSL